MSITTFENGSVLYTGNDMTEALLKSLNCRNNYDNSCLFCKHESSELECDGCSVLSDNSYKQGCSCHINPPCSYCTDNHFEPSGYLINYKHYKSNGWKWECFKSTKNIFDRFTKIESRGFEIDAETLSTGEISMTITANEEIYEIELCEKKDFKLTMEKMIKKFNLRTKLFC